MIPIHDGCCGALFRSPSGMKAHSRAAKGAPHRKSSATNPLHGLSLLEGGREASPKVAHSCQGASSGDCQMWGMKAPPPHSNIPASASVEIALKHFFSLWPILHLSHCLHMRCSQSFSPALTSFLSPAAYWLPLAGPTLNLPLNYKAPVAYKSEDPWPIPNTNACMHSLTPFP